MSTLQESLTWVRERLKSAGLETPEVDARLLLQAATGLNHENILLNNNKLVTDSECKTLTIMVNRRLAHEPVSRILGNRPFWKFNFKISFETLDPRADSEILIESVLKRLDKDAVLRILDLGTGTGCLLLSLLQDLPQATGLGIDISAGAIKIAQENAEAMGLSGRASFRVTSWTDMGAEKPFDVVISNPPYIPEAEILTLAPEVKDYDPYTALAGGADGLACYRQIAVLLPQCLVSGGYAFLEIGSTQAGAVKEILAAQGADVLEVAQDLSGHNRCVIARRA